MKKVIGFMVTLVLMISILCTSVFAATVGQKLTSPETGWKRIDDKDSNIIYSGMHADASNGSCYNKTATRVANGQAGSYTFKFYGTKLRLISYKAYADHSRDNEVKIDGVVSGNYSSYDSTPGTSVYQLLVYEKTGMSLGFHSVEVAAKDITTYGTVLDAIDIDDTGYLVNPNVPSQPTDLSAIAGDAKVDLSWTAVDSATSYNVQRATTAGGPYETITSNITEATYNDTGLTNGTTYYYVVTAVNTLGESSPSNEASATPFKPETKPEAPINLTALGGDSKVDLTWSATEGANTYTVKRSTTAGGTYTAIAENLTFTNYSDTDVTNRTTYYYIVTAINDAGESDSSNEASATPQESGTPEPTGDRAILVVTMTNGVISEYDLSISEVNAFVKWYEDKADGYGKAVYTINKNSNVAPFLSRKDYLNFDKIYSFEVKEYKIN